MPRPAVNREHPPLSFYAMRYKSYHQIDDGFDSWRCSIVELPPSGSYDLRTKGTVIPIMSEDQGKVYEAWAALRDLTENPDDPFGFDHRFGIAKSWYYWSEDKGRYVYRGFLSNRQGGSDGL